MWEGSCWRMLCPKVLLQQQQVQTRARSAQEQCKTSNSHHGSCCRCQHQPPGVLPLVPVAALLQPQPLLLPRPRPRPAGGSAQGQQQQQQQGVAAPYQQQACALGAPGMLTAAVSRRHVQLTLQSWRALLQHCAARHTLMLLGPRGMPAQPLTAAVVLAGWLARPDPNVAAAVAAAGIPCLAPGPGELRESTSRHNTVQAVACVSVFSEGQATGHSAKLFRKVGSWRAGCTEASRHSGRGLVQSAVCCVQHCSWFVTQ
jgi:hypothetical protein